MIKYISSLLVLLTSISFAEGPLQSRRFFSNNKGLINHISPLLVPDGGASSIENITMDDRGQLTKRNGYTVIQSTTALGYSTWTVVGGGFHKSSSGADFFAVVVGSDIYRIGNSFATYSKVTGNVSITNSKTNLAQSTNFNDAVVFCNDVDLPFYTTSTSNSGSITGAPFTAAKTCATYGNYLIVGNTIESGNNQIERVRWSDINNQNSWPALNYIDAELGAGDPIVSMVSFDESVYIFKQRSIYRMLITGDTGANAFIIRPVSRNVGAWSKNSVQVIPNVGIAFLAQNTAYLLSDNGLTPIGDPIQRTFDSIPRTMWSQAVGGVYPKKFQYWLSISTAGSNNTQVLVYDYIQRSWTVYDDMNLSMIQQATSSTGDNLLITGGYNGTTWQQDNGNNDQQYGITGTSITATYTTGNLFADSLDVTKNFKYLYVVVAGNLSYTLTINPFYDLNSASENSQSITVGSNGAMYDVGSYDIDIYPSGNNTVIRLELNRTAKMMQLQFQESDQQGGFGVIGFTVVYTIGSYDQ